MEKEPISHKSFDSDCSCSGSYRGPEALAKKKKNSGVIGLEGGDQKQCSGDMTKAMEDVDLNVNIKVKHKADSAERDY